MDGKELEANRLRHAGSRAVSTECGGVHARVSKTGINVSACSNPYSGQAVV